MKTNDHYVSRTYLKQFANSDGKLIPYWKGARQVMGKAKSPKQVCHEPGGDSNPFLQNASALSELLVPLENRWAENVEALSRGEMYGDLRFGIAQYIAFLRSCTPTAQRLTTTSLESSVATLSDLLAANGGVERLIKNPEAAARVREGLATQGFKPIVDRQYAKALMIQSMGELAIKLYTASWLVLHEPKGIKFITSDNPLSLVFTETDRLFPMLFTPLTPNLAVAVKINPYGQSYSLDDLGSFEPNSDLHEVPSGSFVELLNDHVIKNAERCVLHSERDEVIAAKVSELGSWRVDIGVSRFPEPGGVFHMLRHQLVCDDA